MEMLKAIHDGGSFRIQNSSTITENKRKEKKEIVENVSVLICLIILKAIPMLSFRTTVIIEN